MRIRSEPITMPDRVRERERHIHSIHTDLRTEDVKELTSVRQPKQKPPTPMACRK